MEKSYEILKMVKDVKQQLHNIKQSGVLLDNRIRQLSTTMDGLDTMIAQLKARLEAISTRIDAIYQKVTEKVTGA